MGILLLRVKEEGTMKKITLLLCSIALVANGNPTPTADAKPEPKADATAGAEAKSDPEGAADSDGNFGNLYLVNLPSGPQSSQEEGFLELIPVDLNQIFSNNNRNIPSRNFDNDPRSYTPAYNQQEQQQSFNYQRDQFQNIPFNKESNLGFNNPSGRNQFKNFDPRPFNNNQQSNFGSNGQIASISTPPITHQQNSRANIDFTNLIADAFKNQQGQIADGNQFNYRPNSFNNNDQRDNQNIDSRANNGFNNQIADAFKNQQGQMADGNQFNYRPFNNNDQRNNQNIDSRTNIGFNNLADAFKNQQGQITDGSQFSYRPNFFNNNDQRDNQNIDSRANIGFNNLDAFKNQQGQENQETFVTGKRFQSFNANPTSN